jgi:hypothetical protein
MKRIICVLLFGALFVAMPAAASAQSPTPSGETDVFGNMPGIVYLLIPLAIAGALYLSHKLSGTDEPTESDRRVGAVSRALAQQKEEQS